MQLHLRSTGSALAGRRQLQAPCSSVRAPVASSRPRGSLHIVCSVGAAEAEGTKTVIQRNTPGDMPFPWSEKDPYKLPVSIERVQKLLLQLGWEKPWVEQVVDRIMKNTLRTTEERTQEVVEYLTSVGLRQDEVCNMSSISVVLLGLNPKTRLKPVVDYLISRGVPAGGVPDIVLKHPRIFEYKVEPGQPYLVKGKARIQVDVLPSFNGDGSMAAAVNYFREGASFLASPVSPVGPIKP